MNVKPTLDELFERRTNFPDPVINERFKRLVGIDAQKNALTKMLGILVNPDGLFDWGTKYHPNAKKAVSAITSRPPLIILAGDVGTGKTELAETVGDSVARQEKIDVILYPLSLSTRGQGRVGEMTQLISAAFDYTIEAAQKLKATKGKSRGAIILLIDEADALAQSRESSQMHHEDKAGVNAFIRGIDRISKANVPAAVIMCTNRLDSLDPAIKRRAAELLFFERPNLEQRNQIFKDHLEPLGINDSQIKSVSEITGASAGRSFGFTYSDITQRLIPSIILDAYPDSPVKADRVIEIVKRIIPTPPFKEGV